MWLKLCKRVFKVRMALRVIFLFVNKTTRCIYKIGKWCKWKNNEFRNVAWHWHGHLQVNANASRFGALCSFSAHLCTMHCAITTSLERQNQYDAQLHRQWTTLPRKCVDHQWRSLHASGPYQLHCHMDARNPIWASQGMSVKATSLFASSSYGAHIVCQIRTATGLNTSGVPPTAIVVSFLERFVLVLKKSEFHIPSVHCACTIIHFSRTKQRAAIVASPPGIGWWAEGFTKYNSLYDAVVEDCVSRGGVLMMRCWVSIWNVIAAW